eukprot:scaffold115484_cov20-Tisochrysis_lutea.AAC.2
MVLRKGKEGESWENRQEGESWEGDRVPVETLQIPINFLCFLALWWMGPKALLSQCVSFPWIDVGRVLSTYVACSDACCAFICVGLRYRFEEAGSHV